MCGLVGILGWDKSAKEAENICHKMLNTLDHRGPDNRGLLSVKEQGIYLAQNRLEIVQLGRLGNQPMTSSCGRYEMIYNGEIYNHLLLRKNSEKLKETNWKGFSDTETLIELVSAYGVKKTLTVITGMYIFCIFYFVQII